MRRVILGMLLCILSAGPAAAQYCGEEKDDGKNITIQGTLKDVRSQSSTTFFEIEECEFLFIFLENYRKDCRVGQRVRMTGEFCFECDLFLDDDEFDVSSYSCR